MLEGKYDQMIKVSGVYSHHEWSVCIAIRLKSLRTQLLMNHSPIPRCPLPKRVGYLHCRHDAHTIQPKILSRHRAIRRQRGVLLQVSDHDRIHKMPLSWGWPRGEIKKVQRILMRQVPIGSLYPTVLALRCHESSCYQGTSGAEETRLER